MDVRVNDIVLMKKPHPCGGRSFQVLRVGMDFRFRCLQCGHCITLTRVQAEKNIRTVEQRCKGE